MNEELVPYAAAAAAIALLHAVLPTHWLPFAIVGRAQGWPVARRVGVAAAAALGHAAVTAAVGLAAAILGREVAERLHFAERLGGAALLAFGLVYAAVDIRHLGHRHAMHHVRDGAVYDSAHHRLSDRTAIASLVLILSVSPCIALVPVFFETGRLGLGAALAVAGVNAAVTVACMVIMVGLASLGVERLRLERLERFERPIVGVLLAALGAVALLLHDG